MRFIEKIFHILDELRSEKFPIINGTLKNSLGAFPHSQSPRVIFAQISGEIDIAKKIHDFLYSKLVALNLLIEKKLWTGHITLCRLKKKYHLKPLTLPMTDFLLKKIALLESTLTANGPKYSILKEIELYG